MNNIQNNLSISESASYLMCVGFAKLDTLYVGLVLIGVGVVIKILVAFLNKEGIAVSSDFRG